MVHQPPTGARDLLPLDVAQQSWIEKRLQQVFHRWGYHRIMTSTLERLDTLMAGGAIQRANVIQFQDAEDEILGLRPELTASIARTAVTRMAEDTYPQRLYYHANIFRRSRSSADGTQHEFYQTGVELLGADGILADSEILLLLSDCLQSLGCSGWHLILGEAGLTRSLLSPFPPDLRDQVRLAIANLDQVTLETLPLSPELRQLALFILGLRGKPQEVLQRISNLELAPQQQEIVNNLKSLTDLLQECYPPTQLPMVLDLSLLQTFDYYTGIVFEVVSHTHSGLRIFGQGGRYDHLLELYHPKHKQISGIGFALNIEELHQFLLTNGEIPHQTPTSDWLVAAVNPQAYSAAFIYAQKLRASSPHLVRVEIDLGDRKTPDLVREYAQERRISQIAWVKSEGIPEIETLANE